MTTNQSEPLTCDRAVELLNRAVEEKGADFVYRKRALQGLKTCVYTHNGKPDCIIGYVLHYLGIEVPEADNTNNIMAIIQNGVLRVADERTERLLEHAQIYQDQGETWGEAVRMAVARS